MKIVKIVRRGSTGIAAADKDAERLINEMARATAYNINDIGWEDDEYDPVKMSFCEIVLNLYHNGHYYEAIKFISFTFHINEKRNAGYIASSMITCSDKARRDYLHKVIEYAGLEEEYDEFINYLEDVDVGEERCLP